MNIKAPERPHAPARAATAAAPGFTTLFEWAKKTKGGTIVHPSAKRSRVSCNTCGKTLSLFPKATDVEPVCCEDVVDGIDIFWCAKCTDKMYARAEQRYR